MKPVSIFQRNHWIIMVALSFLCGCLTALHVQPGLWALGLLAIAAVLGILLRRMERSAAIAVLLCCFTLGMLRTQAGLQVPQPQPGTYEISGFVSGGTQLRSDQRISFALKNVTLNGVPVEGSACCSAHYSEQPPELFDGAQVRFSGRVYLPEGKSGEPHLDFRLWMLQRGMCFGIASYKEIAILNEAESAPIVDAAYRIRQRCSRLFERAMGENSRIAMALLFGERSGLTEDENAAFAELGIAHVMAVSGLHVGILGMLVLQLLRRTGAAPRLRLLILSVFLTGYCALTGFSASALRAAIMLMLYTLGKTLHLRADRITILAASMLVVLLLQPLQAFSAGFVLSYAAMLGIVLGIQPLQNRLDRLLPVPRRRSKQQYRLLLRMRHWLIDHLALSLSAQLGVLLPTAVYFHQFPLYGVLINLAIVPLVGSVLVPLFALLLAVGMVPVAGTVTGWCASLATDVLLWLVQLLSRLPHAALRVPSPPVVLCIGVGIALVLLSRRVPASRTVRRIAAALAAVLSVGCALHQQPAELRYIQVACGQADCALLFDGDRTILIDAGDDGQAALDYLLDECRDIDALYLTHLHWDHIGGVTQLLENSIRIRQVYLPVNAQKQLVDPLALALLDTLVAKGIPIAELASGDELRYNKTVVHVLWPVRENVRSGQDANDAPLVLSIDFGGYTILSASDLTGPYEQYAAVPADVLKAAHHGSSDSTREAFLRLVDPSFALISCSSGSRTLPGTETLARLEACGAAVFRTDRDGDILLAIEDGALTVTPYKAR